MIRASTWKSDWPLHSHKHEENVKRKIVVQSNSRKSFSVFVTKTRTSDHIIVCAAALWSYSALSFDQTTSPTNNCALDHFIGWSDHLANRHLCSWTTTSFDQTCQWTLAPQDPFTEGHLHPWTASSFDQTTSPMDIPLDRLTTLSSNHLLHPQAALTVNSFNFVLYFRSRGNRPIKFFYLIMWFQE